MANHTEPIYDEERDEYICPMCEEPLKARGATGVDGLGREMDCDWFECTNTECGYTWSD